MPQSEYKARQVAAKTHEVFEYDRDDEKPGKPLHILIPGGLIALATLALIIFIAYQTWIENNLAQNIGVILIIILSPFYVGGVFLFSYGYELYNIPRAKRLTAIRHGCGSCDRGCSVFRTGKYERRIKFLQRRKVLI